MQNVATSIFYARLFAGIYDALPAAFFSYLPTYPPTALFLPFSPPHTAHPARDPLRSLCHSSFSCAPRTEPSADLLAFSLFLRPRFCFFLHCLVYLVRRHPSLLPFPSLSLSLSRDRYGLVVFSSTSLFRRSTVSPVFSVSPSFFFPAASAS